VQGAAEDGAVVVQEGVGEELIPVEFRGLADDLVELRFEIGDLLAHHLLGSLAV
jgi:hypothetical protein